MSTEPPPRRRLGRRALALNLGLTMLCGFTGLLYAGYAVLGIEENVKSTTSQALAFLGCLAVLAGLLVWLWWRDRTPLAFTLVAAGVAVALPLDAAVALVGAVTLLHRRRDRWAWVGVGAAIAAAGWAFARDLMRPVRNSALATIVIGEPQSHLAERLSWNVPLATAIFVLVVGSLVIGLGLYWRSRGDLAASRKAQHEASQRSEALASDLARSTEREQIAREVHDALGHDLSLLSLQAAALELDEGADPGLAQSARAVRTTAQEAHKSLSSLVDLLRRPPAAPDPHEHVEAAPGLAQLSQLLTESSDHGMPLTAVVLLADIDNLDPATDRTLYRIVQESLTNARRHAPGAAVSLHLAGNPADGIRLNVSNPVTGPAPERPGNGIVGMQERVNLAGGTLTAGPTPDGRFLVAVWLPWQPRA